MILLTADWHLDDDPANDYRWLVFDALKEQIDAGVGVIYMLGDLCDKKDRHSAQLVNRLLDAFVDLKDYAVAKQEAGALGDFSITILRGNHDDALRGKAFWNVLNHMELPIFFIDEPFVLEDQLFLPHSADPASEWPALPAWQTGFANIKVVFMHQTVTGAKAEGAQHRVMDGKAMPKFPSGLQVYSGDIHLPQTINWGSDVVYVGAPHLVRFGDDHNTRMLQLDESSYMPIRQILLYPPSKRIIICDSLAALQAAAAEPGDAIRIRFTIPPGKIEQWPLEEAELRRWAAAQGITIASIEPIIEQYASDQSDQSINAFDYDPINILYLFSESEGLDEGLVLAAEELLAGEQA